ncbi:S-adenosyl-L-methionine-dependent methyltransferase [Radiomyces spectabilis]|uniref:S-adenosyl-L-methionine-dependent methyltransferase n=1 Tax=Radiomyces spectabilis TaxID=64574 RepID=UPI0022205036|nr:S-adenosyl-L-methionine-dependent methyltransferase [Radiomyces spectabilis]KAI8381500.1 S-adenosyl-L-methionine-dependent methyltransferase [Radiomyces spectabilis]
MGTHLSKHDINEKSTKSHRRKRAKSGTKRASPYAAHRYSADSYRSPPASPIHPSPLIKAPPTPVLPESFPLSISSPTKLTSPPKDVLSDVSVPYASSYESTISDDHLNSLLEPGWKIAATAIASAEQALEKLTKPLQLPQEQIDHVYDYELDKEKDRQKRQHYMLKQVFNGNMHIQLEKPSYILDCACGVGVWALETALEYPESQVIGMDIQSYWSNYPLKAEPNAPDISNVSYCQGDLLKPLAFSNQQFDFIYQRDVSAVVPWKQWPLLIAEFYRILRPEGQIELVEYDCFFKHAGPVLTRMNEWYKACAARVGVDLNYPRSLSKVLLESGFTDIQEQTHDIPIGEWPTDTLLQQYGFLYKEQMKAFFKSMRHCWISQNQITQTEFDQLCATALEEFDQYRVAASWKIITARKSTK